MRALMVTPGVPGSAALREVPEPALSEGTVLVATQAVGICGTDLEIVAGEYGQAPAGEQSLVLGHESLGRVLDAPDGSGFQPGDPVVAMVRHPDPVPCKPCAAGEWDMCRNGKFTEHGIKGLHGFARERFRAQPDRLVRVAPALGASGVLLEPASVVAKAWEHIEHIGSRATWAPERVLVTGAGSIGLLAALLAVQRGLDVHVIDLVEDGPKPELVRALGATYSTTPVQELELDVDVVLECTGVSPVISAVLGRTRRNGIVCLAGVSSSDHPRPVDVGGLNRELVLENDVVFGSVNANRRHYEAAATALATADPIWLAGLLRRTVPVEDFAAALESRPDDVKTVVGF